MSSYHSSFSYNGENSFKDKSLIVVSFEPDRGFTDSFLSIDNVSDEYFDGTKKINYGSKYSTSAEIQITLIKKDGRDMTLNEFRTYAKWLTGARVDSWLDVYSGDTLVYSFLGKFTNMEQYKLDARTVGIRLTFSSISPWAFSATQVFNCNIGQLIDILGDGVVVKSNQDDSIFGFDNGVICPSIDNGSYFNILEDGTVYVNNAYKTIIDNESDDLYTFIYLDIDYKNKNGTYVLIENSTLQEKTIINNVSENESISISAKQFIISDIPNKLFGDDFNFVWPRLQPGLNNFIIDGNGTGSAKFTYRYPMKVGDCTMDISIYGSGIDCGNCDSPASYDTVRWKDIVDTPTTIGGYGITDAYTDKEVDEIIENIEVSGGSGSISINEEKLDQMLSEILQ